MLSLLNIADVADFWNIGLNVAALVAILSASMWAGRGRGNRDTISDLESGVKARDIRIGDLEQSVARAQATADRASEEMLQCAKAVAGWEARYEELEKYTARPAIEGFENALRAHVEHVAERHAAMIRQLGALEAASGAHGELALKQLEMLARIAKSLDLPADPPIEPSKAA